MLPPPPLLLILSPPPLNTTISSTNYINCAYRQRGAENPSLRPLELEISAGVIFNDPV
jgi:hypothetical protein